VSLWLPVNAVRLVTLGSDVVDVVVVVSEFSTAFCDAVDDPCTRQQRLIQWVNVSHPTRQKTGHTVLINPLSMLADRK